MKAEQLFIIIIHLFENEIVAILYHNNYLCIVYTCKMGEKPLLLIRFILFG